MAANGVSEIDVKTLEMWKNERSAAGSDPKKRQRADQRFIQSLRDSSASQTVIDSVNKFIGAIPGKELEGIDALIQLSKGRVSHMQDLQKEQAQMMMHMKAEPEQAKIGIASFATSVATIARFFGANDFANMIESKAKEILSSVHVDLDASKITDGGGDIVTMMDEVQKRLKDSSAPAAAAAKANEEVGPLPTPSDNISQPPASAGTSSSAPTTWDSYKKALKGAGIDQSTIDRVSPAWSRAAKLSGDAQTIDTPAEVKTFQVDPIISKLPERTKQAITGPLLHPSPEGNQTH